MLKKLYFVSAILWSCIVLVLCLIRLDGAPHINVDNVDKYVHAFFHFVFTMLWFLYFNLIFKNNNKYNAFGVSFVLSVLFGIFIEIVQQWFTESRSGDVFDVLANVVGATLSISLFYLLGYYNCLNKLS